MATWVRKVGSDSSELLCAAHGEAFLVQWFAKRDERVTAQADRVAAVREGIDP